MAIVLISRRDDTIGFQPHGNEANASTVAVFTETEGGVNVLCRSKLETTAEQRQYDPERKIENCR